MRQITRDAINAFTSNVPFSRDNTTVHVSDDATIMRLHGNLIAKKINGELFITDAGWDTMTTKERLNGLPGVQITQKKSIWYLNGEQWDGEMIKIS